ncbi:hypothetical protein GCM10010329_25520 [Streptomyces spiroverticillatus]|nr:hypothetical protein GCM10010329_25520 [Streptomyces spiroverticillatus]
MPSAGAAPAVGAERADMPATAATVVIAAISLVLFMAMKRGLLAILLWGECVGVAPKDRKPSGGWVETLAD